jgi:hypothetical protein
MSSDITFPRSATWERSLSDGGSSLKDGVHCALTRKLRAEKLKARQVDDLCDRFNVTAV